MTNGPDPADSLRYVEYRGRIRVYMEKDSYSVQEWALLSGISQETVRKKCRAGDLYSAQADRL